LKNWPKPFTSTSLNSNNLVVGQHIWPKHITFSDSFGYTIESKNCLTYFTQTTLSFTWFAETRHADRLEGNKWYFFLVELSLECTLWRVDTIPAIGFYISLNYERWASFIIADVVISILLFILNYLLPLTWLSLVKPEVL
jgi:hypothetical protein